MFGNQSEPVTLVRDVRAIIVPAGMEVNLKMGSLVYITQAMGGSFTVYFEGSLFHISGSDADALGREPVVPPALAPEASDQEFEKLVWDQMRTCYDPEIPINVVELGLIYTCNVTPAPNGGRDVYIEMTLTAPGCGMGPMLVEDVRDKVSIIPTAEDVSVELVFDPPWHQGLMSEAARLEAGLL